MTFTITLLITIILTVLFIALFIAFLITPFFLNDMLALSRGKSRPITFLLTLIFSWIVTIILAFLGKKKEVALPNYFKRLVAGIFIVSALLAFLPSYYVLYSQKATVSNNSIGLKDVSAEKTTMSQSQIGEMLNIPKFEVKSTTANGGHTVTMASTIELNMGKSVRSPEIEKLRQLFKDHIIEMSYEEIPDIAGKRQLKKDLIKIVNNHFQDDYVQSIYLTEFIVR